MNIVNPLKQLLGEKKIVCIDHLSPMGWFSFFFSFFFFFCSFVFVFICLFLFLFSFFFSIFEFIFSGGRGRVFFVVV